MTSELKMTMICGTCSNQYGLWRPRCPTCGTSTPISKRVEPERLNTPRMHERRADECIFCRRRKARETCPHCNEPIHRDCRGVHVIDCAKFQLERSAEIARVSA